MLYKTEFSFETVDEQELYSLAHQLAKLSGQKVEFEKQIIISTDNSTLSLMLDSLRDAIVDGAVAVFSPKRKKPKADGKKLKKAKPLNDGEKHEPTRGPHVRSIKVNSSGEMISRFELNHRLDDHSIDLGTELHSPKYGLITVAAQTGDHSLPYVVIDGDGKFV